MIVSIPVGFLAMWSVDKFGLRSGVSELMREKTVFRQARIIVFQIIFGSLVNLLGAVIRVISSIEQLPTGTRFALVMLGKKELKLDLQKRVRLASL